jgi:hypothetical protein
VLNSQQIYRFVLKTPYVRIINLLLIGILMTEFTDEEEVDLGCVPMTSTPEKDYSGKHELTPSSKLGEPHAKKRNTSESPESTSTCLGKFVYDSMLWYCIIFPVLYLIPSL